VRVERVNVAAGGCSVGLYPHEYQTQGEPCGVEAVGKFYYQNRELHHASR
jgi:hypothetical protein